MKYKKLCLFALILGLASCGGPNNPTSGDNKPSLPTTSEQESTSESTSKPTTSEEEPSLDPTTSETPSTSESTSEDTSIPETSVPEPSVPETSVPETSVPETSTPETSEPETSIPESSEDTTTPETSTPEVPTGKKLSTPTNLVINEWKLTWNEVNHADYYLVTINGMELEVEGTTQDLIYATVDGVVNTVTVQAMNTKGTYEPSDIATLKYDGAGGPFEGIRVVQEESYVDNLTIKEEDGNKVIEVPFNEISGDDSFEFPDVVIDFDYDVANVKFTYDSNNAFTYVNKVDGNPGKVRLAFKEMGEIQINVCENGDTHGFVFDSITIRSVKVSSFVDFNIKAMEWDIENNDYKNITTNEYNVDLSTGYAQFAACDQETEVGETEVITWKILEGESLVDKTDFNPTSQTYLTFKGARGKVVLEASSTYGDVDTITINIK